MATLSASGAAGQVTVTGTGYTAGQRVPFNVAYSGTGRRYNELRVAVADGSGNISAVVPCGWAGSVTSAALNMALGTILASSGTATVT
jgi:hypothetical protein